MSQMVNFDDEIYLTREMDDPKLTKLHRSFLQNYSFYL